MIIFILLSLLWWPGSTGRTFHKASPFIPSVTKSAMIGPSGGNITLRNNTGYTVELSFPEGAVNKPVHVTVTLAGKNIRNPITNTVFPGLYVEPENLLLKKPATLRITFPPSVENVNDICLFCIMRDDYVVPLGNLSYGSHSLQGEIYFLKNYAGGIPTGQEILGQTQKAVKSPHTGNTDTHSTRSSSGGGCPPLGFGWQGTQTDIHGLLQWASMLSALGNDAGAAKAIHAAETAADNAIKDFLKRNIPDKPCGNYTRAAWQYFQLSKMLEVSDETSKAIEDRALSMAEQCAIQFSIKIDRQIINNGNEKQNIQSIGVVYGHIPRSDFSDAEATASAHGTLSYSMNYEWIYNNAMKYKSTANASGTIDVTCDGHTYVKETNGGQPEIRLKASLHFKENISGTSCDTGDKENPCQDTKSHKEWNESVDFPFRNGSVYGKQMKTKHGFVKNIMTLYITRMDQQEEDSGNCY